MAQETELAGWFEASMNFDMENVRPFLEQVEANLSLGLNVDRLVKHTEATQLDTANGSAFQVTFDGEPVEVRYSAYLDDLDAPDLYFFVKSEVLADAIDAEMEAFCGKMGI
ncbi:hypothetical protein [Altererythrobacter ishigakiensis]|uniref:Uncharacterized protein n=1 Tax=Altererythrobacter ishigakiensis TaxID=476157 RepID=A0A562UN06_9SPHN|nr:hypothetical protein [Altererythrobacter ishigakiensis]TWJ07003.1 hypothetical protein JN10_2549 [Altererythrobacter ishigakiensis]